MNGNPFRTPLFQWGFEAWNASATLSPACLAHYAPTADTWRCIFAQYAARELRPMGVNYSMPLLSSCCCLFPRSIHRNAAMDHQLKLRLLP